jgi:hypothetical protein
VSFLLTDSREFTQKMLLSAAEHVLPAAARYQSDPVGWVTDKLGEHLWSAQQRIMQSIVTNRYTAVPSCHGAGKSYTGSRLVSWWLDVHQVGEAFAVTTAPTAAQVEAVLWREIRRAWRKGKLTGHITQGNVPQWKMDDEIVAYGRKPADTDADAFQGIHAKYILIIIDEANGIPKVLWDAVDSLATNVHARVLAIGNPDNPGSHFKKICDPGSGWNVIRIDALKTPNFTGEWVPDSLREDLVSEEWVRERLKRWGKNSPLWRSKVRGQFPNVSSDTLIWPMWVEAAQQRWEGMPSLKIVGRMAADIARYGDDETCIYRNREGRIEQVHIGHKQDTMSTTGVIKRHIVAFEQKVETVVDAVGVGAGVVDRLNEQGLPIVAFEGGRSAFDSDRFMNSRAEAYWHLREAFEEGLIGIDPNDDILAGQLVNIHWTTTSDGKIKIESKDDYRKRTHASSPDRADALSMLYTPHSAADIVADDHVAAWDDVRQFNPEKAVW